MAQQMSQELNRNNNMIVDQYGNTLPRRRGRPHMQTDQRYPNQAAVSRKNQWSEKDESLLTLEDQVYLFLHSSRESIVSYHFIKNGLYKRFGTSNVSIGELDDVRFLFRINDNLCKLNPFPDDVCPRAFKCINRRHCGRIHCIIQAHICENQFNYNTMSCFNPQCIQVHFMPHRDRNRLTTKFVEIILSIYIKSKAPLYKLEIPGEQFIHQYLSVHEYPPIPNINYAQWAMLLKHYAKYYNDYDQQLPDRHIEGRKFTYLWRTWHEPDGEWKIIIRYHEAWFIERTCISSPQSNCNFKPLSFCPYFHLTHPKLFSAAGFCNDRECNGGAQNCGRWHLDSEWLVESCPIPAVCWLRTQNELDMELEQILTGYHLDVITVSQTKEQTYQMRDAANANYNPPQQQMTDCQRTMNQQRQNQQMHAPQQPQMRQELNRNNNNNNNMIVDQYGNTEPMEQKTHSHSQSQSPVNDKGKPNKSKAKSSQHRHGGGDKVDSRITSLPPPKSPMKSTPKAKAKAKAKAKSSVSSQHQHGGGKVNSGITSTKKSLPPPPKAKSSQHPNSNTNPTYATAVRQGSKARVHASQREKKHGGVRKVNSTIIPKKKSFQPPRQPAAPSSKQKVLPFVPHMSMEDATKLSVHDKIDHRDFVGQFVLATVTEKQGSKLKIHYDGWSHKWDTWSDFSVDLHRFAVSGSISLRPSHRAEFIGLEKGDFVDVNPRQRHCGWKVGEIRALAAKSGQVQVGYELPNSEQMYCHWAHLDNSYEIASFASKSSKKKEVKAQKKEEVVDEMDTWNRNRLKRFPRNANEEIRNKYEIGEWLEIQDKQTSKWITATVTDKENNWICVQPSDYNGPFKYEW
eukprot:557870_1